ncbi:class I adenylate-forming enzyme family protein [Hyphomicrobium sp. MC1]|uniref:class I adenylate-forming enzyme family protein n=1 Tax=Hyphomicrobium sp. (strain MC1) TaxID=717785 RepID=UPI000213E913|nr:class I adenylate-forming enzyme family protein [Hyphomicrobium sp. MC1]CCB66575.1 AMP-dependent synthetase and ligase [Hyphomicrobium sp. MC1]
MSAFYSIPELDFPISFATINHLLADHASRWPDKRALVDLDQGSNLTYADLASLVDSTARNVLTLGIGAGDKVVLLADETLEKVVLWLAIWRVGAVICPLNIEMNERHLVELCETCAPRAILMQKSLSTVTSLPELARQAVLYDRWTKEAPSFLDVENHAVMRDAVLPDEPYGLSDLSTIFCTSGTTEKPKLVVADHFAHWAGGLSMIDALGLTPDDRTLEYRSFGWASVQMLSLMPFLQLGLTLHFASKFSRSRFFAWIEHNRITFAVGVPTVIAILLEGEAKHNASRMRSLRLMTCSTAPLSAAQWQAFEDTYELQLIQMYGMSEANWICANRPDAFRYGTVGRPVLYQKVDIVDPLGASLGHETEGEISVSGPHVAVGYLIGNDVIEPIRGTPLKTGDLGIIDADGFVHITGRSKDLIIRGGMNIAPSEIDSVLSGYAGVREAAAVGVPDRIYGEEVVCFVVEAPGATVDAADLTDHCRRYLPPAKVPKNVFFVDELPRNDRGKVLRSKLRETWTTLSAEETYPTATFRRRLGRP